jgi:hypothetical protein
MGGEKEQARHTHAYWRWWFSELLGLAPPQGALRQQVIDAMLALTDEHTSKDEDVL